jgi:hypothetical protein
MTQRVYIRTFGCQMNEYDSDRMADALAAGGYERCERPEDADLILFNTCSVREKAQEKVFADLGRVKHLKRARPEIVIGVGGCVASQEGGAIVARAPYVDLVFGPQTLHRLPELLAERRRTGRAQVDVSFPEIEKFDRLPPPRVAGPAAFVSIMEGCSKYCSFCVVPYTRGEEVSRRFEDVLTEVADLSLQGVREITLLGQNVNAYRGRTDDGETADLALLLDYLAEVPGIERIRFTTSHPREFTPRLVDCFARTPKLVSHVHLPVQSGADRVLAAMKRGYTALEYKAIVRRLRAVRPGNLDLVRFHRRLPRRDRARLRAHARARGRGRLRRVVRVRVQPPPGHAGGGPSRRHAAGGKARAPAPPAGGARAPRPPHRRGDGRHGPAGARGRPGEEGSVRALRPHRQQPRGQLRRPSAPRRQLRRRHDRRGARPQPARHRRRGGARARTHRSSNPDTIAWPPTLPARH